MAVQHEDGEKTERNIVMDNQACVVCWIDTSENRIDGTK